MTRNQAIVLVVLASVGFWLADLSKTTLYWACAGWVAWWLMDLLRNRKDQ